MPPPKEPIKRQEYCRKLSESHKGKNNPMFGKRQLEEHTKKIANANKGKKRTQEFCKNLSESRKGEKHPLYGKHLSEETRRKLSEKLGGEKNPMFGKQHTESSRIKISEAKKGEKHHLFGKHLPEETRKKLSDANKGHIVTEKTRKKISVNRKGKPHTEETRRKMSENRRGKNNPRFGKPHTEGSRRKMSENKKGEKNPLFGKRGENAPNWKGGKSFEPYPISFNNAFKEWVRSYFNYHCVECGLTEEENKIKYGCLLSAHHWDYDKNSKNCVVLCKKCHLKTNDNREYWQLHFEEMIALQYGGKGIFDKKENEGNKNAV
jgi:hypothetical protein